MWMVIFVGDDVPHAIGAENRNMIDMKMGIARALRRKVVRYVKSIFHRPCVMVARIASSLGEAVPATTLFARVHHRASGDTRDFSPSVRHVYQ
jgi:hypothetical protein